MTAERHIVDVQEVHTRVEHLLSYYRGLGEEEQGVVQWLEVRRDGIIAQLERQVAL